MTTCPDGTSERELVARTLTGDDDAFADLVHIHQAVVYNIAYRLVGWRETAQDLAQEAFLRAFKALRTFDLDRPFGPWLYRIATNLSLNHVKRARLPTVPLEVGDETKPSAIPDVSSEPAARFARAEVQMQLREAILSLPPDYRAVIELRHFQEMSYARMAQVLNMPVGTVKTHLFRARRLLRKRLSKVLDR